MDCDTVQHDGGVTQKSIEDDIGYIWRIEDLHFVRRTLQKFVMQIF